MCNCNVCASGCPDFPAAPTVRPHKHAALIKAWADGATIECQQSDTGNWMVTPDPKWYKLCNYRVQPTKKTPGHLLWIAMGYGAGTFCFASDAALWEERACQFLDAVKGQA